MSSPFAQIGTRNPSTNDGLLYINGKWVPSNIGQGIPAAQPGTSAYVGLPLLPKHDDEWVYQAAVGVYWRFKYDVYSSYWNFIGGPSLASQGGSFTNAATITFENYAAGPSVTTPFAGDYDVEVEALSGNPSAGSIITKASVFTNTGSGAALNASIYPGFQALVTNGQGTNWSLTRATALTAGGVHTLGFYGIAASTTWSNMRLAIIPVRVH